MGFDSRGVPWSDRPRVCALGSARASVLVAALVALGGVACVRMVDVTVPPIPERGSLILVVSSAQTLRIFAADAGQTLPALSQTEDLSVHALIYACGLERLDVARGWSLPSGAFVAPVGPTIWAYDASTTEWSERATWPPGVVPATPDGCARFTTVDVPLPGTRTSQALAAISLGDDRVLVATTLSAPEPGQPSEAFFIVDARGATRVPESVLPPGTPNRGAFRDAAGRIFLVGIDGRMAVGTLDDAFIEAPPLVATSATVCHATVWLDGAPDGSELYAVTSARAIQRFDGARWTSLVALDDCPVYNDPAAGDVMWLGPGRGLAVVPDTADRVWRLDGDAVRQEALEDRVLSVVPSAIGQTPGWGLIVGARIGGLYVEQDRTWELIPAFSIDHVRRLGVLDDSLLCSCGEGVTEFHPEWGRCGDESFAVGRHVRAFLKTESGLAIVSSRTSDVLVTFATWTRPVSGCGG